MRSIQSDPVHLPELSLIAEPVTQRSRSPACPLSPSEIGFRHRGNMPTSLFKEKAFRSISALSGQTGDKNLRCERTLTNTESQVREARTLPFPQIHSANNYGDTGPIYHSTRTVETKEGAKETPVLCTCMVTRSFGIASPRVNARSPNGNGPKNHAIRTASLGLIN